MKSVVRTLAELGDDLVLAPERHLASSRAGDGVPLGELVALRGERVTDLDVANAIVLDTTHARDGVLDLGGALRDIGDRGERPKSAKKRAYPGDVLVSRLRPYLRQIAYVHPAALAPYRGRVLAVSSEYYVLAPKDDAPLAWLASFLLGDDAQRALADAQEGGHHPRVPRPSLMAVRVPHAVVAARARTSKAASAELAVLYRSLQRLRRLTGATPTSSAAR